jgi:hypothetical protein
VIQNPLIGDNMTSEENSKVFLTCRQFNEKYPWPSESALRAIIQDAAKRGFSKAFVRYGRRILINPNEFWAALERQQQKGE